MNNPKVGERVAVFMHWSGTSDSLSDPIGAFLTSPQECRRLRGVITALKGDTAQIKADGGRHHAVPIRHLRRLTLKGGKMADWADEKANTLRIDLVESPANTAYFLEQVSQALREAEARGMERAAEMTWVSGDANECCQELFEQHQYNLRAEVKKCTGEVDNGK